MNAAWAMYIQSSLNVTIFGERSDSDPDNRLQFTLHQARAFTVSSRYVAPFHFAWQSETHIVLASKNYDKACIALLNCQQQIFNIDSASAPTVTVYGLSTIGTTYELSVDHKGVVNASSNMDGFQETLTNWHY